MSYKNVTNTQLSQKNNRKGDHTHTLNNDWSAPLRCENQHVESLARTINEWLIAVGARGLVSLGW